MTCATCLDKLIAYRDNLLSTTERQQIRAHLEVCSDCLRQWQLLETLEDRIGRNAEHWQQVKLEEQVLDRILNPPSDSSTKTSRSVRFWQIGRQIMQSPKTRVAAAAVVALAITLTVFMSPAVSAQQVLKDAIEAVSELHAVHMKARMRTLPRDNFAYIGLQLDFVPIEMWKRSNDKGLEQWRIEKPGRVAVVDGIITTLLIRPDHVFKEDFAARLGSFDTWFGPLLNVDKLLENELKAAEDHPEREVLLTHETIDGEEKTILQVEKPANVTEQDYLRNQFMMTADRSLIYQFDANTNLLESFHVFVHTEDDEVLVFEITEINYNPEIDDSVFTLELPEDTIEYIEPQILSDNERYEAMSPKEMATAFFQACAQEDWDEVLKFRTTSRLDQGFKTRYGGLTVISIGEPFQSEIDAHRNLQWFVPYEIKLRSSEERYALVSNKNAVGRNVIMGWYNSHLEPVDIWKWTSEPASLVQDSPYVSISPEKVVETFTKALSNYDFDTMLIFAPPTVVKPIKMQITEALEQGINVKEKLPEMKVLRSFWSEEHQGTFVVTSANELVYKHNLAIRKDNKAHRFVVDGGL